MTKIKKRELAINQKDGATWEIQEGKTILASIYKVEKKDLKVYTSVLNGNNDHFPMILGGFDDLEAAAKAVVDKLKVA